ncbi:MAG: hypothetical protein II816_06570, partial [Elusimicrobia bacterium]|nr:hypothetical protein [Elusimicrobiota bacterium]
EEFIFPQWEDADGNIQKEDRSGWSAEQLIIKYQEYLDQKAKEAEANALIEAIKKMYGANNVSETKTDENGSSYIEITVSGIKFRHYLFNADNTLNEAYKKYGIVANLINDINKAYPSGVSELREDPKGSPYVEITTNGFKFRHYLFNADESLNESYSIYEKESALMKKFGITAKQAEEFIYPKWQDENGTWHKEDRSGWSVNKLLKAYQDYLDEIETSEVANKLRSEVRSQLGLSADVDVDGIIWNDYTKNIVPKTLKGLSDAQIKSIATKVVAQYKASQEQEAENVAADKLRAEVRSQLGLSANAYVDGIIWNDYTGDIVPNKLRGLSDAQIKTIASKLVSLYNENKDLQAENAAADKLRAEVRRQLGWASNADVDGIIWNDYTGDIVPNKLRGLSDAQIKAIASKLVAQYNDSLIQDAENAAADILRIKVRNMLGLAADADVDGIIWNDYTKNIVPDTLRNLSDSELTRIAKELVDLYKSSLNVDEGTEFDIDDDAELVVDNNVDKDDRSDIANLIDTDIDTEEETQQEETEQKEEQTDWLRWVLGAASIIVGAALVFVMVKVGSKVAKIITGIFGVLATTFGIATLFGLKVGAAEYDVYGTLKAEDKNNNLKLYVDENNNITIIEELQDGAYTTYEAEQKKLTNDKNETGDVYLASRYDKKGKLVSTEEYVHYNGHFVSRAVFMGEDLSLSTTLGEVSKYVEISTDVWEYAVDENGEIRENYVDILEKGADGKISLKNGKTMADLDKQANADIQASLTQYSYFLFKKDNAGKLILDKEFLGTFETYLKNSGKNVALYTKDGKVSKEALTELSYFIYSEDGNLSYNQSDIAYYKETIIYNMKAESYKTDDQATLNMFYTTEPTLGLVSGNTSKYIEEYLNGNIELEEINKKISDVQNQSVSQKVVYKQVTINGVEITNYVDVKYSVQNIIETDNGYLIVYQRDFIDNKGGIVTSEEVYETIDTTTQQTKFFKREFSDKLRSDINHALDSVNVDKFEKDGIDYSSDVKTILQLDSLERLIKLEKKMGTAPVYDENLSAKENEEGGSLWLDKVTYTGVDANGKSKTVTLKITYKKTAENEYDVEIEGLTADGSVAGTIKVETLNNNFGLYTVSNPDLFNLKDDKGNYVYKDKNGFFKIPYVIINSDNGPIQDKAKEMKTKDTIEDDSVVSEAYYNDRPMIRVYGEYSYVVRDVNKEKMDQIKDPEYEKKENVIVKNEYAFIPKITLNGKVYDFSEPIDLTKLSAEEKQLLKQWLLNHSLSLDEEGKLLSTANISVSEILGTTYEEQAKAYDSDFRNKGYKLVSLSSTDSDGNRETLVCLANPLGNGKYEILQKFAESETITFNSIENKVGSEVKTALVNAYDLAKKDESGFNFDLSKLTWTLETNAKTGMRTLTGYDKYGQPVVNVNVDTDTVVFSKNIETLDEKTQITTVENEAFAMYNLNTMRLSEDENTDTAPIKIFSTEDYEELVKLFATDEGKA